MKKVCISIPIHGDEDPQYESTINLIDNFRKYYENNVVIILHGSKQFGVDSHGRKFLMDLKKEQFINGELYFNPISLQVEWGNLIHVHNSNFLFAKDNIDFDVFLTHASNDMYVKKNALNYISQHDNGIIRYSLNTDEIKQYENPPSFVVDPKLDPELRNMMRYLGLNTEDICISQIEGAFFQKDVLNEIVKVINKFYTHGKLHSYPREECYYSTLISKFVKEITSPNIVYSKCTYGINKSIIKHTKNGTLKLQKLLFKTSNYYDCSNLYAVKGIPRNINDPLRIYVNNFEY